MKIVKFEDGTYGIKRKFLFLFDKFLSKNHRFDNWWTGADVSIYCKHQTLEEARKRLASYNAHINYEEIE